MSTIPWPIRYILRVVSSLQLLLMNQVSRWSETVTVHSVQDVIQNQNRPPSLGDRFTRWFLFRPETLLPPRDLTVYNGLRWGDLPGGIIAALLLRFVAVLDVVYQIRWGRQQQEERRRAWQIWYPENPDLPVFSTSIDLLEYALNNIDTLDLLHSAEPLEIRTEFLNTYAHKDPSRLTGATIRLDRTPTEYRIRQVRYCGTVYTRETLPPSVAHLVLSGVYAYVTVASHAYGVHYRSGHVRAEVSHALLPETHPVRLVVMPSEVNVTNGLGRAAYFLLNRRGVFAKCSPFTFEGLQTLLSEYHPWDPSQPLDPRTELVCGDHDDLPSVLQDYRRWWRYLQTHMSAVVRVLYPTDEALADDTVVTTWMTAVGGGVHESTLSERLVNLLAGVFFCQVRHNYMSSPHFGQVGRYLSILEPQTVNVTQGYLLAITHASTTLRWVPLVGRGFGQLLANHVVYQTLQEFYVGLGSTSALAKSMHHPYSLPSAMEASSGV